MRRTAGVALALVALAWCGIGGVVRAADIDEHLLYDPVRVQVLSRGLGPSSFTDPSRNYDSEYRAGIYSFMRDGPMGVGGDMSLDNLPLATFTRDTGERDTRWYFTLTYNQTRPRFHPYNAYMEFALTCNRQESGDCEEEVMRKSSTRTKVFKVLKHDDMPDESDDDDDGRGKKRRKDKKRDKRSSRNASDDDDALNMDLTTPLTADEVIPRVKSYAETQAEQQKKMDEARAKAEAEEKRHGKKHRKDDKDRDRDRDRD